MSVKAWVEAHVFGKSPVEQSADPLKQVPVSLLEGGLPPKKVEPRPRRKSRKQMIAEMDRAARESFAPGRMPRTR